MIFMVSGAAEFPSFFQIALLYRMVSRLHDFPKIAAVEMYLEIYLFDGYWYMVFL